MTREILFRGKTIDNKKWVYGYLERDTHWQSKKEILLIQHSLIESTQIIPETATQFTGLKDKNGVKIFEGDIIKHWYYSVPAFVEFMNGSFVVNIKKNKAMIGLNTKNKDTEIIGNIFEKKGKEK